MNADDLATQLHRAQDKIAALELAFEGWAKTTGQLIDDMADDFDSLSDAYGALSDFVVAQCGEAVFNEWLQARI